MKTKLVGIVLLSFMLLTTLMQGQSAHSDLRIADDEYDKENYVVAEEMYRNAVVKEPSAQAKFNLGNTLFKQERFEEASKEFQQAVNLSNDTVFRAKALYNKGNSLLQQGDLAESLKSYKRSLLLNPNDEDAKRNFMLAMQKKQEQEQQQQQNDEENKDQENKDQQQNNQDSNPPPDEGDQPEQNEEQTQQEEQNEQKEENKPKPEDSEMNREEAEQLLQIIENTDSYVQKKIKKQNSTKKQGEKNW